MAANTKIVAKVFTVNTTGFITSDYVMVHGYVQSPTAITGHRMVVVERRTGTQVMGIRAGAGISLWVGPIDQTYKGLSCTVLSAGGSMTIYQG